MYGAPFAVERYYCRYGLNPEYVEPLERGGLVVSGVGDDGAVRIVELPNHPFFVATLFLPQASATSPHPLFVGFAAAIP